MSAQAKAAGESLLVCQGLQKTFNAGVPGARPALDGLDFTVYDGEFVVVIGSNGAGKSTLLNVIAGMVAPDSGSLHLAGRDITRLAPHRRAGLISRVFQDPMIGTAASMTIEENLGLAERRGQRHGLAPHLTATRRERYGELLGTLNLGLEDRLAAQVAQLSGGQRQALSLMMAVLSQPRLLLLDEHTAALDPRTAELVMDATVAAVARLSVATIMITHNIRQAIESGTRLVMMNAGRIVLDVSGAEKAAMTPATLIERFRLDSDRMLLS